MLDKPEFFNTENIHCVPEFDKSKPNTSGNIDDIFNQIVNIYTQEELSIVLNVLNLLKKTTNLEDSNKYIDGLNSIMNPTYVKIKKWINDNIAL